MRIPRRHLEFHVDGNRECVQGRSMVATAIWPHDRDFAVPCCKAAPGRQDYRVALKTLLTASPDESSIRSLRGKSLLPAGLCRRCYQSHRRSLPPSSYRQPVRTCSQFLQGDTLRESLRPDLWVARTQTLSWTFAPA